MLLITTNGCKLFSEEIAKFKHYLKYLWNKFFLGIQATRGEKIETQNVRLTRTPPDTFEYKILKFVKKIFLAPTLPGLDIVYAVGMAA